MLPPTASVSSGESQRSKLDRIDAEDSDLILVVRMEMGGVMRCARFSKHTNDDPEEPGQLRHGSILKHPPRPADVQRVRRSSAARFWPSLDQQWPAGKSTWGQRKTEFWLRLKSRYRDFLAGRGETVPDADEEDQAFAAETDLRDFLANNLDCVEAGLRLYRQGEEKGIEFPVEDGRIDILATDKAGRLVVFEMKLARGREKALGQLLYYMGWVDKNLGNGACRGVIVAKEISDALVLAAQRVEGVSLFRYKLSVSVERVS